jgi:hypothetical protein
MSSPSTTISPSRDAAWMGRSTVSGPDRRRIVPRPRRRRAPRSLCLRRHLRHQQRARLRLPARQHEVRPGRDGPARHRFAIVDEVDSILIDEARTPLIISGPSTTSPTSTTQIDKLIPELVEDDYELDEKHRSVSDLTEAGNEKIEQLLREAGLMQEGESLYDAENVPVHHHVNQALRAHKLFQRDRDYIVRTARSSSSTSSPAA